MSCTPSSQGDTDNSSTFSDIVKQLEQEDSLENMEQQKINKAAMQLVNLKHHPFWETPPRNANQSHVFLRGKNYKKANQLKINEVLKTNIIDTGADTCVLGQGWSPVAFTDRKVNVVGFDEKMAIKKGLPIVTAITAVEIEGETCILRAHESVFNKDAHHTLLSDFQLRES